MIKESKKEKEIKKISWTAPEFLYYEKGILWSFALTLFFLGLAAIFFILSDYLTSVIFFLAWIVFLKLSLLRPKEISCHFSEKGLQFKNKNYPWEKLKSFWIAQKPSPRLYLRTTSRFQFPLAIELGNQNLKKIKNYLERNLPYEKTGGEILIDRISREIKF